MTEYDAVLFDNDGVLVEPPAHETQAEATRAAFREAGAGDVDPAHVDAVVSGVTVAELRDICDTYGLDPTTFWAARERHDERSQLAAFRAGRRDRYDDVAALADLPHDCGVVSNNHHSTVAFVLDHFDLAGAFETYYGREKTVESLRRKKPDPHYLHRALEDLDAESALYVGDSASDVLAAREAGVDAAFVRRSHSRGVALPTDPAYEVTDLHGVVDAVGGSPRTDPDR